MVSQRQSFFFVGVSSKQQTSKLGNNDLGLGLGIRVILGVRVRVCCVVFTCSFLTFPVLLFLVLTWNHFSYPREKQVIDDFRIFHHVYFVLFLL